MYMYIYIYMALSIPECSLVHLLVRSDTGPVMGEGVSGECVMV